MQETSTSFATGGGFFAFSSKTNERNINSKDFDRFTAQGIKFDVTKKIKFESSSRLKNTITHRKGS